MAKPVWNSAWQAYDDGLGHMWRNESEGWVAAPAAAAAPAARPVVGGFAQEVPSTAGQRIPNGGRAGVTAGTGTSSASPPVAGGGGAASLTNSPRSLGTPARTIEEWYGDQLAAAFPKILLGWATPEEYPGVPAQFFGMKQPGNANYNENIQVTAEMLRPYLAPLLQQQYAASGLNLPSVPQQDPNVIGANTSAANNAATNTANTTNTNATIAGNKAIAEGNNATTIAAQKLQNEGALAVANVKAGTDMASIQAQKDIAAGDRTSRETIAANALAESMRQFDVSTAEGARQFNATSLISLLDKGIQLAQKPVDWIGYQYFMNNLGLPMNALTTNAAVNMFGAVPPTGPSAAGPVTGGPGTVYGDTSFAQQAGISAEFVPVSQAVAQNPGGQSADPQIQAASAGAMLPQWQQQAGGANQLDAMLAQSRQKEVAPSLRPDDPARAALLQQMMRVSAQPLATPQLPQLGNGGFGTSATPAGGAAVPTTPSQFGGNPPPVATGGATGAFGQPFASNPMQPDAATVAQQAANGMQPYQVTGVNQVVWGPAGWTGGTPISTGATAPQGYVPASPLTLPSMAPASGSTYGVGGVAAQPIVNTGGPDSAQGQMVNIGGNTGGSTGIYTGPSATSAVTSQGSVPASQTGANTPQGSDMIAAIAQQLGRPYEEIAQIVNPALIAGGYSAEQIAQTPVIQGLQNPNGPGFGGAYRTAPVGDSKFGTIQAFGIPLDIRGGQDINAQSFMNTTAANRDMIQGAVEATGQSWPDVQQQMLRSSPVSNYQGGAFGRRVY